MATPDDKANASTLEQFLRASKPGWFGYLNAEQQAKLQTLTHEFAATAAAFGLEDEQLSIWGVSLVELKSLKDGAAAQRCVQVVLLKFLRARQWDVVAALDMLIKCLKWRKEFDIANLPREVLPPQLDAAGRKTGRDRVGNPVTYNMYGAGVDMDSVLSGPAGVATFVRWRVGLMEGAVRELEFDRGVECVTQVHDYSGASMFAANAAKGASKEIIRLFQDNYPEMLSAKLFLNVPRVMEFLFGIFAAFCDAATRAKFVVASPARSRLMLFQYVDPGQVPARLGGFNDASSSFLAGHTTQQATLQPGETAAFRLPMGSPGEAVWGFTSTGAALRASVVFTPSPGASAGGPAAAAAAPGSTPLTGPSREDLSRDLAYGRLALGVPGEVTLTLENPRGWAWNWAVTVYFILAPASAAAPPAAEEPGKVAAAVAKAAEAVGTAAEAAGKAAGSAAVAAGAATGAAAEAAGKAAGAAAEAAGKFAGAAAEAAAAGVAKAMGAVKLGVEGGSK
ncbi:hypothetical protein HYH03_017482 [Edaphochlamys debaryana]|uniref:CRAL-TRIO domain-containing protein n=1 Tax=Edaphochlamys debaryana TaxID=47281 RepID=A0A835XP85_9CHLO|nr:hypothetical protein HYH03_017482 [Edaphochlamys debaryana]|eukprot:KAG2483679.1 hypothetical protein HYH03_017482 [Edaphochlamys debaryana]